MRVKGRMRISLLTSKLQLAFRWPIAYPTHTNQRSAWPLLMFAAGASGMWIALPLIGAVMVYGIVRGIIRKRNGKECPHADPPPRSESSMGQ